MSIDVIEKVRAARAQSELLRAAESVQQDGGQCVGKREVDEFQRRRERMAGPLGIAKHFRCLAEQHVQRQVDRGRAQQRITDRERALRRRSADHRIRAALARAQRFEFFQADMKAALQRRPPTPVLPQPRLLKAPFAWTPPASMRS